MLLLRNSSTVTLTPLSLLFQRSVSTESMTSFAIWSGKPDTSSTAGAEIQPRFRELAPCREQVQRANKRQLKKGISWDYQEEEPFYIHSFRELGQTPFILSN